MEISYDGLIFDVVKLESWQREAEYSEDMTTFLWWKHEFVITCLLNADATSAGRFAPTPFAPDAKPRGPVGAPGQARNAKPFPTITRGQLRPFVPAKDDEDFDVPDTDGPLVGEPKFGGGGDFAPEPSPGPNTGAQGGPSITFPQPGVAPDVPIFGGGDFGGKGKQPGKPFVRFGPGRFPPGRPNPHGPAALSRARPTVPPTDVELRQRLRRPRRQLLVWLNSGPGMAPEYMLVSPIHPQAQSDAQHGPLCTILDVPEVHGEATALMRLAFVTWESPPVEWTTVVADTSDRRNAFQKELENLDKAQGDEVGTPESIARQNAYTAFWREALAGDTPEAAVAAAVRAARKAGADQNLARQAARNAAQAFAAAQAVPAGAERRVIATPALLSNRWTMSFGWNPDTHMQTQAIEGEATFRMDVLRLRGLTADQLRRQIWHPVPPGYRRRPVGEGDVVQSSDGASIKYRCVDEEVLMNSPGGARYGIIRLDIVQDMLVGVNSVGVPGATFPITKVTAAEPS